ncbi:MAG: hypothetical protein ACKVH8_12325 [Pirellulales bacterium]
MAISVGCGGDKRTERVTISGKVMIDGKPLGYGFIQVVPDSDRAAQGVIQSDGSFQLTTYDTNDGCVLGNHKVAIIGSESQSATGTKWHAPMIYSSSRTSGLTLNVTEAKDNVVIELTWDGKKPFIQKYQNEGADAKAAGASSE